MDLHAAAHVLVLDLRLLIALRVPLLAVAFLVCFPVMAVTKARTLFLGLFDQTPRSLLLVTIAAFSLSSAMGATAHLVELAIPGQHLIVWIAAQLPDPNFWHRALWVAVIVVLTLPILITAIYVSHRQKRSLLALAGAAILGLALSAAVAWVLIAVVAPLLQVAPHPLHGVSAWILRVAAQGDWHLYSEHLFAACAFGLTLAVWAGFGLYGYSALGKPKTVPALASLLMLLTMLTWLLGAMTFYLDHYGIPALLLLALLGMLNALCPWSDHIYRLVDPVMAPSPNPAEVLTATRSKAVIVVAAEGGGIQAAAWTAQVLEGLRAQFGTAFDGALRMISGVSGGSVGTACYMDWLLHPEATKKPSEAAALSSLDEVAWGMAWPDFLRAAFPWGFGWTIGRGTALERAWSRNCAADPRNDMRLTGPLSMWRAPAASASPSVPAVIMNSTVVESGNRLLLGTSVLERCLAPEGREDAAEVNCIGNRIMDVSVATAARLSATFTWVTPAARANVNSHKPHLVDGGYYDDYGMATLVEWLDEALQGAGDAVKKVLVLQVRCAPLNAPVTPQYKTSSRGWFFQAIAPIKALIEVRSAGQVAHNDIELALLQEKWRGRADVQSVTFEFPGKEPPLSWHLTEEQKKAIRQAWETQMGEPISAVADFLSPSWIPQEQGVGNRA